MKTVKILGDTLNKVADTSTVFDFRLWNGGQAQDVTGKTVSFVIANDSGYLFDVPAVVDGTVVSLDFANELLKQLTPDAYHMEVSVTNVDGDVAVYPSQGTIDFTVSKNLHSTQGKLVPQITFDTVLRSVDEKIVEYTKTIAKGDKGDTGPQGPQGIQGPVGPVGPQGPSNDSQLVHKTGNEVIADDKTFTGKVAADNLISNGVPVNLTKTTTFKSWFGSEVTAYRNGNVVTIVNNKQDASLIFDTTHSQEAIPLGYRPSVMVLYPVIYGTSIKGQIQINTDGTFQAHGAIDGPYQLTATYITSDSWPV
ncbi:hypothetical protein ACGYLH_03365 [Weissella confusa]|uniref:hypothetical protein n=1 Tax=Weissella confusa TaxID=1583 RepID=UPI003747007F